jgi:hypothetical protein
LAISAIASLSLSSTLHAQASDSRALVVTEMPGPVAQLLEVDLETGDIAFFGSFPSKFSKPLAVEMDPVNRQIILAVADGPNSRILNLYPNNFRIVGERELGTVPGWVSDLVVNRFSGSIFATVIGHAQGIYRLPRNGGDAEEILPLERATAMDDNGWVAQSADPLQANSDPQFSNINLDDGEARIGATLLSNASFDGVAGIVEIPSAIGWVLIAGSDGSITRASAFAPPVPVELDPPLQAGAASAIELENFQRPIIMGNGQDPFIRTFSAYDGGPIPWQALAGPLPGKPVGFDLIHPNEAGVQPFGPPCAEGSNPFFFGDVFKNGQPVLGNLDFRIGLSSAEASSPAFLVLGFNDAGFLGQSLPITLPAGGCDLLVSGDRIVRADTNAAGEASVNIPIPNSPELNGLIFYGQWLILDGNRLETSGAGAVHVFNQ